MWVAGGLTWRWVAYQAFWAAVCRPVPSLVCSDVLYTAPPDRITARREGLHRIETRKGRVQRRERERERDKERAQRIEWRQVLDGGRC